jgi:glycosyltransferase involved in cell wall biosynthesis
VIVLSVAYPFARVSLDSAGGAEQVLALIDRRLVEQGHNSVVIAAAGSRVSGNLIEVPVEEESHAGPHAADTYRRWREALAATVQRYAPDIVHLHGLDFDRYLPSGDCPVLATLHLPSSFYTAGVFHLSRSRTWLNCVSASQRRSCPQSQLLVDTIENGIPLDLLDGPASTPAGYALAMGRICPEKGFHLAVEAADKAGVALWVAGKVFPYPDHVRYWRDVLGARLQPPHRFLGPITMADKPSLLAGARCLLVTSSVAETSSLVAMEAMACGTPVIAFPVGALSELIEPGATGLLVNDPDEMADAICRVAAIDRERCRAVARARFSDRRMFDEYLSLYGRLLRDYPGE